MLNKRFLTTLIFIQLSVASAFAQFPDIERAPIAAQAEMWSRYNALVDESPRHLTALNPEQRKKLLEVVSANEVAALGQLRIFDPPQNNQPTGEIGYCYGRAMAVHLIARKMGLAEESMKKIFAAGDMQNAEVRWRFHMATIVKGEDGLDYVIDPIMPTVILRHNQRTGESIDPFVPVQPELWTKLVAGEYDNTERILETYPELKDHPDFTGTIKFYVADTDAIMIDMREVPAHINVENGRRINEILFNPMEHGGFTPQYFSAEDEAAGKVGLYTVDSERAKRDFFMIENEPLVDQFNFFELTVTIYYILDDVLKTTQRFYLYNGKQTPEEEFQHYSQGYFPSLLTSIENMTESF